MILKISIVISVIILIITFVYFFIYYLPMRTLRIATQHFNEWLEIYGRIEARQMTVDWLRSQNNVQEAGISDDGTIWILFTNDIEGDIETYPPRTLGGSGGNSLISPSNLQKMANKINAAVFSGFTIQPLIASNQHIVVGNNKVIVLDPFLDELSEESPQPYVYSKISPLTNAAYLKNEEVTIDAIKTIYGYGVVNITTHGRLHRNVVGFLSGEKVTLMNIFFHIGDLRNKRLSIGWHGLTPYYEILPTFITNYTKEFYPKSLIYIGACQSLKNVTMAEAFLSRGVATYFGFTRTTSALFNKEKAEELFTSLIDKRQTTGEAFTDGLDPYWPGANPEYGYESEPAKFDMVGEFNLALLLAVIPPGLADTPWPMFQHDVGHTGQSEYVGAQTSNLRWRYKTGSSIDSSPAIDYDGTVYIGSTDKNLYAINPDGTLKWKYETGGWIASSPAIGSSGTIYVGSQDSYLYAINPDGTLKWRYKTGGYWINSSPAVGSGERIYVGGDDGYLHAINSNSSLEWKYKTGGFIYSSPAIDSSGVIYIGATDGYLYAINLDGNLKWKYKTGFSSSPSIGSDGTIYVGSGDYYLYAINSNGSLKWKYKTGKQVWSTPAIDYDGTVYIGSNDYYLYAINPDGALKWKFETNDNIESSPAIGIDGTIYVGSDDTYIYAVSFDGTLKWKYGTRSNISHSSPAIDSNGTVYIGSLDYNIYAFGE